MVKDAMCDEKGISLISVLLVDHNSSFLRISKECLNIETGLKVETALSVDEALIKLREKKTDVIVSEIMSPDAARFEFLKTFWSEDKTIPVIVFTIEDESDVADEAMKMGASGFIGKFGDPSLVFSKLKNCIVSALREN
jgi:DNA-binding NtrC family response regulator